MDHFIVKSSALLTLRSDRCPVFSSLIGKIQQETRWQSPQMEGLCRNRWMSPSDDEQVESDSVKQSVRRPGGWIAGDVFSSPWILTTALTAYRILKVCLSLAPRVAPDPVHSFHPSPISLCLSFFSLSLSPETLSALWRQTGVKRYGFRLAPSK